MKPAFLPRLGPLSPPLPFFPLSSVLSMSPPYRRARAVRFRAVGSQVGGR